MQNFALSRVGPEMKRTIAINEKGRRIGESHWRATMTDAEIELLLALREQGWSYRQLAEKFEISKSAVRWYCIGGRRCQLAVRFKVVHISG
jgi:ribosome-binding protein aMBF1 (putative translation factor)